MGNLNNIKFFSLIWTMVLASFSFAQEGTTEEEYRYLTKGYAYQSEMGLDHKKEGYLIQSVYTASNDVEFIGMFHSFSGKIKAYLAIVPKDEKTAIHICIPNNAATESIRRQFLQDKRKLLSDRNLQDKFDEAWRAFFYHQSNSGLNWRPQSTTEKSKTPVINATPKQAPKGVAIAESTPKRPVMTSRGVLIEKSEIPISVNEGMNDTNFSSINIEENNPNIEKVANTRTKNAVRLSGEVLGDLSDRLLVKPPVVKERYRNSGKVVIKICVDQSGDVIYAKFTQKGSTTFDAQLKKLALESVHDAIFEKSDLSEECGVIAFDFK